MINVKLLSNRAIRGTHYKTGAVAKVSAGADLDYMIRRGMVEVVEAVEKPKPKKAKKVSHGL